jgi:hypothetical protein
VPDPRRSIVDAVVGRTATGGSTERDMHELCDVIGHRPAGSPGEARALAYILGRYAELGLAAIEAEPFEAPHWRRGPTSARITAPIERSIRVLALPHNLTHRVRAPVVCADFETAEEFAAIAPRLKGAICLNRAVPRVGMAGAMLHRSERIRLAHEAGAAAFLWTSNLPGHVLPTGSMSPQIATTMPAFGITLEDATLIQRLDAGGRTVELDIDTRNDTALGTSHNAVAELPGAADGGPILYVTAHYDSHDVTEGAFDNAAGCAVVLAVAEALAEHAPALPCRVRFAIFSAEEVGLVGSSAHARAREGELRSVRFLFNADGLGAVPSWPYVHVPFRSELVPYLRDLFRRYGQAVEVERALALNWDHAPFAARGVPVASITASWPPGRPLHYGHTPSDTLEKLDLHEIKRYAAAVATAIVHIALDDGWALPAWTREEVRNDLVARGLSSHLAQVAEL